MPFSISKIKNKIKPVRPNLFYVRIGVPRIFYSAEIDSNIGGSAALAASRNSNTSPWYNTTADYRSSTLPFRCEAAEFPGRTIATSEDTSHGPAVSFAYDTTYSDMTLTFIVSEDMKERGFFDIWMETIMKNTGGYDDIQGGRPAYYDDIVSQVEINQLDQKGENVIGRCRLEGAFPISLSSMNLSWEEQNTYQRFTVTFNYRYHHVDYTKVPAKSF